MIYVVAAVSLVVGALLGWLFTASHYVGKDLEGWQAANRFAIERDLAELEAKEAGQSEWAVAQRWGADLDRMLMLEQKLRDALKENDRNRLLLTKLWNSDEAGDE